MSLFEDAMSVAVQLPMEERVRLAQALGVGATGSPRPALNLPLHHSASRPDPVAWRKAERGHAVLATDRDAPPSYPPGAGAIAGMWAHHRDAEGAAVDSEGGPPAGALPKGSPAVVHTDVCHQLALGEGQAVDFFANPPVEVRLATATYLALLGAAEDSSQQERLRSFVQPFAVLSLGPMASSQAAALMFEHALANNLGPLDALIAATAMAHEIPLITTHPSIFADIPGLTVCRPY